MTIYAVESNDYESSMVTGLYSSRELAEASWDVRNHPSWYDIVEYELDFDHKADEPDIDPRPRLGPRTKFEQQTADMYSELFIQNLTAMTALSKKIDLPMRTGNEIKFFSYKLSKSTTESI